MCTITSAICTSFPVKAVISFSTLTGVMFNMGEHNCVYSSELIFLSFNASSLWSFLVLASDKFVSFVRKYSLDIENSFLR